MKIIILSYLLFRLCLTTNGQIFVAQRVKFIETYKQKIINKNLNINYTELNVNSFDSVFTLDSSTNYLFDAHLSKDSINLFYQTPENKIIIKTVKCPIKVIPIEPFKTSFKYLNDNLVVKNKNYKLYNDVIEDSNLINISDQEVVLVYNFDSIEIAINQFNGYLRIYKNGIFFKDIMSYKSIPRFGMNLSHQTKNILDKDGNRVLYLVFSDRLFTRAKKYLVEFNISTGEVIFKSPFKNNLHAFYLKNSDVVFVSAGNSGFDTNVYIYNRKAKKVDYGFLESTIINAILIGK